MSNQQGLGLPEVLIALLLASLITVTLIRHYLSIQQQYHHIQGSLEQGIDLQLVSDLIRDSARKAGFTPCMGIEHLIRIDQRNQQNPLVAIEVGENGLQRLRMSHMSEHFDMVLEVVGPSELLIESRQSLRSNQAMMIADCYHAEVQTIRQIRQASTGQLITLTHPLAYTYRPPIYIGAWIEEVYFMQNGGLFYQVRHPEELTKVVVSFSARLENRLLQVRLGLNDNASKILETMVRNP